MQHVTRRAVLRALVGIVAAGTALRAAAALAEQPRTGPPSQGASPFANALAPDELAALRGRAIPGALPAVRLWDEVGGRGGQRNAPPGGTPMSDGTLTIRVRGR